MTWTVRILRGLSLIFTAVLALTGVAAVGGVMMFFVALHDLPSLPPTLQRIIETPPTEIYAANGERILEIGGHNYVPLEQVSTYFIQAILATEDHTFWEHHGINKLRILKALWVTLVDGEVQGASTITQQLAKNLFFTFQRTFDRKFKELLVSLQIEAQFTKQQILEAYINQIYFGPRAQGISAAAHFFFGKAATQLDLAEASLLAGLPQSPVRYNPLRHFDLAKSRQLVVLHRMVASGFISPQQAAAAAAEPLKFNKQSDGGPVGGYFVDWVLKQLEERYGAQVVYHGGLKVTTTLDLHMQQVAQQAVSQGLTNLGKILKPDPAQKDGQAPDAPQAALVSIQVNSGAVKAMVGGRDYDQSEFNRAVENNRQPGSGFKPFLYYTAFQQLGLTPASVMIDQPVSVPMAGAPDWRPQNFSHEYRGPVILQLAFSESINSIAAQLVLKTGPQAVIQTARRCGITSPLAPVYSVALGTSGVSPLEMASAYSTFASGGVHYAPFGIWRVEDAYGQVLQEHIVNGTQVLDKRLAYQVVDMMKAVVDEGTGKTVRRLGFDKPAAGKTGTTNGYKDAWFTGFTPSLCTSVWVGYDRQEGLRDTNGVGITGGRAAAPIWTAFMKKATDGEPPRPFLQPAGIQMQAVDPTTGQPVAINAPSAEQVALLRNGNAKPMESAGQQAGSSMMNGTNP